MISTRLAAILALMAAVPALADPMVVRAIGPSATLYKPGQKLVATTPLTLKAGDQLTILDARGTRSFSGPGRFSLAAASASTAPAFTELLTQKSERRARIGAVRGPGVEFKGKPVPPGIWAVDSGVGGTVCALDLTQLSLWRAEPVAAGSLTVSRASGGAAVPVAFAAGQAMASWPATLAIADGDVFKIAGTGAPATITVRKLAAPAAVDALGAAFAEHGCMGQLDRLAAVTKVADAPAP